MNTTATQKVKIFYFLYVTTLILVNVMEVSGQQFNRQTPKMFLGLEAGTGPRSFKIDSNIKEIDNLTVNQEGLNFGLMFGINQVQIRANHGLYKASAASGQRIDMTEFSAGTNFFPLKSRKKNGKYIKPYFTGAFNANKITFFGSYGLPKPPAPIVPVTPPPCTCTCPGSSPTPGNPPEPADDPIETDEVIETASVTALATPIEEQPPLDEKELGNINSFRADLGAGITLTLPTRRVFMNFFAEAKYGLTLIQESSNYGFSKTKISNPFIINLGIAVGLKN